MTTRRTLLAAGSFSGVIGLTGCLSNLSVLSPDPEIRKELRARERTEQLVEGQPSLDAELPTIWGKLFTDEPTADEHIDWDKIRSVPSLSHEETPFEETDFDAAFLVVVVGVCPAGYSLVDIDDPRVVDGTVEYEYGVKQYMQNPDSSLPDPHYSYEVHRWQLFGNSSPQDLSIESAGIID